MTVRGVTYDSVLQFSYAQSWNGGAANGARYWMALGVGPVSVSFIVNKVTSVRFDAVVSVVG
jgi:hypothetical protein